MDKRFRGATIADFLRVGSARYWLANCYTHERSANKRREQYEAEGKRVQIRSVEIAHTTLYVVYVG